ncbi:MAG: mycothiol synthase [Ilumatobacteraceae bacterium]
MHLVEILRHLDPAQVDELSRFVDDVGAAREERPMSDLLWLDLRSGGSDGFVLVRVADGTGVVGLAQISAANASSSIEVVVRADLVDDRRRAVHDDALLTAVDAFRRSGGGHLVWWLDSDDVDNLAVAERIGLTRGRRLLEMRRTVPHERSASIETCGFRPGVDDRDWVIVNNRAFADHLEQGDWTLDDVTARVAEPWFDAEGFRLHHRNQRLAAFCWTKIHVDRRPPIGEIYVVAVDPDFQGTGLGEEIVLAGLDAITARGVTTATLFVDGSNAAAIPLYDRLGFTVHRVRTACSGLQPDSSST